MARRQFFFETIVKLPQRKLPRAQRPNASQDVNRPTALLGLGLRKIRETSPPGTHLSHRNNAAVIDRRQATIGRNTVRQNVAPNPSRPPRCGFERLTAFNNIRRDEMPWHKKQPANTPCNIVIREKCKMRTLVRPRPPDHRPVSRIAKPRAQRARLGLHLILGPALRTEKIHHFRAGPRPLQAVIRTRGTIHVLLEPPFRQPSRTLGRASVAFGKAEVELEAESPHGPHTFSRSQPER